tara:strand:- start:90 stop:4358 length:4269 start_codon:yes stop_codon:yes gene_type:complete
MLRVPLPVDEAVSAWCAAGRRPTRTIAASFEEIRETFVDRQLGISLLLPKERRADDENDLHTVEVVKRKGGDYYAVVDGSWTECVNKETKVQLGEHKQLQVRTTEGPDSRAGPEEILPAPVAVSLCVESGETFPEKCMLVVKQQIVVQGRRNDPSVISSVPVETRSASDSISRPTLLPYPIASTAAPSVELSTYDAMYLAEARVNAFKNEPATRLQSPPENLQLGKYLNGKVNDDDRARAAVRYYEDRGIGIDSLRKELLQLRSGEGALPLERLKANAEAALWKAAIQEPTMHRLTLHQLTQELEHISESRPGLSADQRDYVGKTPDKLKDAGRGKAAALLRYLLTADPERYKGGHWSMADRLEQARKFLARASDGTSNGTTAERSHVRGDFSGLSTEKLVNVQVKLLYEIQVFSSRSDADPLLTISITARDDVAAGYSASGYVNRKEEFEKAKEKLLGRIREGRRVAASLGGLVDDSLHWDAFFLDLTAGKSVGPSDEVREAATKALATINKKCDSNIAAAETDLEREKKAQREINEKLNGWTGWYNYLRSRGVPEKDKLRNDRDLRDLRAKNVRALRRISDLEEKIRRLRSLRQEADETFGPQYTKLRTLPHVYTEEERLRKKLASILSETSTWPSLGSWLAQLGASAGASSGAKEAAKYVSNGVCIFSATKTEGLLNGIGQKIDETLRRDSNAEGLDELSQWLERHDLLLLRETSPAIVLVGAVHALTLGSQVPPQYSGAERELAAEACTEASRALKRCSRLFGVKRKAVGTASLRLRFERLYEGNNSDGNARRALAALKPPALAGPPFSCLFTSSVAPLYAFDADYRASEAGGASLDRAIRIAAGPKPDAAWRARLERQCTRQAAGVMAELLAVCLLSRAHAGFDPRSRAALASSLTEDARRAALTVSKFISDAYAGKAPGLASVYRDHPCFFCLPGFEYVMSALYGLGVLGYEESPSLVVGTRSRLRAEQMLLVAKALRAMSTAPLSAANLPFPCAQSALLLLPRAVSAATGEDSAFLAHSRASALSLSRLAAAADALRVWQKAESCGPLLRYAALSHPAVVLSAFAASKAMDKVIQNLERLFLIRAQRGDRLGFEQHSWKKRENAVLPIALDERLAGFRLDIPAEVMKQVPAPFSSGKSDYEAFLKSMLDHLSLDSERAVYFVPAGVFGKGSPSAAPDTTLFQQPVWMEELRQSAGRTWHWTKPPKGSVSLQNFGSDPTTSSPTQLEHPCAVEVYRNTIRVFLCPVTTNAEEDEGAQALTTEAVRQLVHNVERLTQALLVFASWPFRSKNRVLDAQLGGNDAGQLAAAACVANALFSSLTGSDAHIIVRAEAMRSASARVCQDLAKMASSLLERDLKAMPLGELCGVLCCYVSSLDPRRSESGGGDAGGDSSSSGEDSASDGPPTLESDTDSDGGD